MKRIITILILAIVYTYSLYAQEITNDITQVFEKGRAEMITPYLNREVECSFLSQESRKLSQKETENSLTVFFTQHVPTKFTILHKVQRDESLFIIATMYSQTEKYRVNLLFRKKNNSFLIHQIRIVTLNE